jgi:hypothetical protein
MNLQNSTRKSTLGNRLEDHSSTLDALFSAPIKLDGGHALKFTRIDPPDVNHLVAVKHGHSGASPNLHEEQRAFRRAHESRPARAQQRARRHQQRERCA